jgi:hypothetical protein
MGECASAFEVLRATNAPGTILATQDNSQICEPKCSEGMCIRGERLYIVMKEEDVLKGDRVRFRHRRDK